MPDRFFFHSKSADAAPGRGVHESANPANYTALTPGWRKTLSNFWISPFELDGHRWNTVEHYFQAKKLYIPRSPERDPARAARDYCNQSLRPLPFEQTMLFFKFCLDPTEDQMPVSEYPNARFEVWRSIAEADGSAAQKRRKTYLLTPHELALWESRKDDVMARAQFAKFSQNPALRALLLATGDAELWHGTPRQPAARMPSLERVREALRKGLPELPPL